ncbi:hypothetical protein [Rhodococcus artemisiae]|uniref:hypothetical protein n=1 Tax=Rhodococcus artemisiae TaxID=714159 RepID=UPI002E7B2B2C|nr:hypothetical protein [Rhodococcus artemisiae]
MLLIDNFQHIHSLENWLCERFLPALPVGAVVVVAGHIPPDVAWQADPGWADMVQVIELGDLEPMDAAALLVSRDAPVRPSGGADVLGISPQTVSVLPDLGPLVDALPGGVSSLSQWMSRPNDNFGGPRPRKRCFATSTTCSRSSNRCQPPDGQSPRGTGAATVRCGSSVGVRACRRYRGIVSITAIGHPERVGVPVVRGVCPFSIITAALRRTGGRPGCALGDLPGGRSCDVRVLGVR